VTVKKGAPLELYHIAEDPREEHNLAAEHPEMVKEFDAVMHRMHKPSENYPIPEDKEVKQ
jgi:arylsulfatase A-like enzyme